MQREYIEQHDGGYRIAGTRISLDSVVYAWQRGSSPESIQRSFPLLALEQVYGAITFYLANQPMVDEYLRQGEAEFEQMRQQSRQTNADLIQKPGAARQQTILKTP
ncbi:MAG: DUF433 domain-containing protein [Blastocatellia bacterium]